MAQGLQLALSAVFGGQAPPPNIPSPEVIITVDPGGHHATLSLAAPSDTTTSETLQFPDSIDLGAFLDPNDFNSVVGYLYGNQFDAIGSESGSQLNESDAEDNFESYSDASQNGGEWNPDVRPDAIQAHAYHNRMIVAA